MKETFSLVCEEETKSTNLRKTPLNPINAIIQGVELVLNLSIYTLNLGKEVVTESAESQRSVWRAVQYALDRNLGVLEQKNKERVGEVCVRRTISLINRSIE